MLNLDRIRSAPVRQEPYPYFVVADAIPADKAKAAAKAFPAIDRPGTVDVNETRFGPSFAELLDELKGDRFRELIAEKFDVDLDDKDILVNVRGQTRLTDGNIHTDTPSKLVTVLLYFNEPGAADDTSLRILNNGKNLDDYVEEVRPDLGTMLAFKVTPNCWHGHKPVAGKRLSLQMNYLSGVKTHGKHQLAHRLVGRMKRKLGRLVSQM
jgi:SM-20-related protein